MAVPKRKTSRGVRNNRRSHHSLTATSTVECSKCKEPRRPHRVCPSCGFYNGKEVISDTQEEINEESGNE